ncbi:hypothetical protein ES288_D04G129100v1 [Gossypium darwinii]|uniref:Uncharacterized protein n=1 Tax=Gossypium darwinii TaxID=34276 RepID=A0A5D2CYC1_GOSDA|nr:hypothetical protein ES288_D04G129100v1 [Gossypium darwinii]
MRCCQVQHQILTACLVKYIGYRCCFSLPSLFYPPDRLSLSVFYFFLLVSTFSADLLPLSLNLFFSFSLQHNLRLAFSTFSFLFLSVTLSLALSWWVFKLLQLKESGSS